MKPKIKILLLYISSFIASCAPVTIYFLINHDKYIMSTADKIKFGCGAAIVAVIIVLKLMGKLKINSRILVFATVFILSYLLEPVIQDALVFSFLALVGEIADSVIMFFVRKMKAKMELEKSAEINAQANEKAIERVVERFSGRV